MAVFLDPGLQVERAGSMGYSGLGCGSARDALELDRDSVGSAVMPSVVRHGAVSMSESTRPTQRCRP
jgi:hypothetical protein